MFFDFEGRNFDAPTIESAISWREQLLSSLFLHLAAALLVFFLPQLPFVQEATQRRVERLAEDTKLLLRKGCIKESLVGFCENRESGVPLPRRREMHATQTLYAATQRHHLLTPGFL